MAKFKPYKILESQLDSLPIKEGQFILTTDTKKLYSDTAANTRILISPDAITDLSVDGTTITYTHLDGTTGMINTQDTTYSVASETKNGLMSADDKAKLNAIEAGAQKNTITGVKGDSETLYRTGNVNITKANIGLNNVENKSSATIRGELTNSNVTTALGYTPLNSNLKGAKSGLAELDANGKVPTAQLPSYVDDVLEYSAKASFPTTGETGKIYVDTSTNKTYRWGGSAYAEISPSIALGTTSSTAFRGDYGQAAYTHAVTNKGSKFDSGLYKIATNAEGHVTGATAVVKGDITALGIPAQDTTYSAATTSAAGLMSAADKTKLDGIAAGAQKNTITGVKGSAETSYRTGNVNITAANIGLGNVENKSSETIRGELTKANVTTALGYTPPTTNTTYEEVTTSKAGLMSTAMVTKLNGIEAGAQKNTITGVKGNSESTYRTGNVNITKANIGLGNVDNTSDADKEVAHAELASNLDIVARVGSNAASSSGWYKVADSTMSGYGNTNITFLIKEGYMKSHVGILELEMRSDNTSVACWMCKWLVRSGIPSNNIRIVINGMKWTLYYKVNSGQYGCTYFIELQHRNLNGEDPTYTVNYYNTTTKETTEPASTISSSDGGSVNYANSAGSATNASKVNGLTVQTAVPANAKFTDTTYTGENGVTVSGTKISNSGVRSISTGSTNGTISVNTNGTAANVAVKGLGSLAYKSSLAASDVGAIASSLKGAASGVAELDSSGKVPSAQLPSYVDDVVEYAAKANFPATGETGKIYVDLATNKTYRWSGSAYVEISPSLALGTTSSTAYRGDYGNTAYTHATAKGSAFAAGLYKITTNAQGHVTAATAVTKADITGLGIPGSDTNTTYTFATGDSNGQIKVTPGGGTASNISVKGLAAGAYKGVDTSIAAASTSTNLPTSKAVAAFVEGKGYKTTDNNTTYTLTQDSKDGHKITLTPSSGTATTITIPDNNTTYTFSNGLSASGTTVSNSGVRSIATGTTNGTLSVNTNGTTANVAVKGLSAAAYKGVDISLASGSTSTNLPTSKAVADLFATLSSQVGGMSTVATSLTCTLPDNL